MKLLLGAALALIVGCTSPGPAGATGPTGTSGAAGQSVLSMVIDAGNASCPRGGTAFGSASGTTYACNGAIGPRGPGVIWKDAAGATVPGAFAVDPFNLYLPQRFLGFADANGKVWRLDPFSGAASAPVVYDNVSAAHFTSSDCSGIPYAALGISPPGFPPPRIVFEFGAGSGVFKTLPDTMAGIDLPWASVTYDGVGCSPLTSRSRGVPLSSIAALAAIAPPSIGAFTPPFHMVVE